MKPQARDQAEIWLQSHVHMGGSPHLCEAELKEGVGLTTQSSDRTYRIQLGWQVEIKSTSTLGALRQKGLNAYKKDSGELTELRLLAVGLLMRD